jgi:choline dehydrogenase-like flavoprotein
MKTPFDCILGSGPAAVACATELLNAQRPVVMVDPNRRLSDDRKDLIEKFRKEPDVESFVAQLRKMRSQLPESIRDKKLPFSSPHVYEGIDRFLPVNTKNAVNAVITRSLASGGLSSIWGATVMPMSERSFRNWPVTLQEMAPFYRSVAEIMDVPCLHDNLESIYPNFGDAPPLPLSEQGTQLMGNLLNHQSRLAKAGILFGRGRSAIGSRYAVNGQGCVACGLCMYGCPFQAIFNAEYTVDGLKNRRGFTYMANRMAERFEEHDSGVVVRLRDLDSGNQEELLCNRLFVACGASTTLRLIVGAMKWFDQTFYLSDTQQVSIPVFLLKRCRAGSVPRAVALSQVFIKMNIPVICDESIHLSVYGFSPFIVDILRSRWGRLINERMLRPLLDRMMVVMGYLPGQLSGKVSIKVAPSETGGLPAASCLGVTNPRTLPTVYQIGRTLLSHSLDFGFIPALPFIEVPDPGTSVHLAGCLPMKASPKVGETDRLGRPYGLQRVHVVDGACFPELPSEHLTYTIMANAARIAFQSTERILH